MKRPNQRDGYLWPTVLSSDGQWPDPAEVPGALGEDLSLALDIGPEPDKVLGTFIPFLSSCVCVSSHASSYSCEEGIPWYLKGTRFLRPPGGGSHCILLKTEKHCWCWLLRNTRIWGGGDKLGWKGKGPPFNSGLSGFIKTRWQEPESSKVKFLHFFPKARLLSLCRTEMISIAFHILRSNFYLIFFAYDIEKYLWFCVWFHDMH